MAAASESNAGDIRVVDEVASTNIELMGLAREGAPHGAAIRARIQTAGRGRRDHSWSSPDGGLYLSVLIKPEVPRSCLPGVPVACGIAVAKTLLDMGLDHLCLKWPNDIVVDGRKLGGILVEGLDSPDGMLAICGIGINMKAPRASACQSGALPATGLAACLPHDAMLPDIDGLARAIRARLLQEVDAWSRCVGADHTGARPLAGILETYNNLLAYRGAAVRVLSEQGEELAHGCLLGVDDWGRAIVKRSDGSTVPYDAALASLRPIFAG